MKICRLFILVLIFGSASIGFAQIEKQLQEILYPDKKDSNSVSSDTLIVKSETLEKNF